MQNIFIFPSEICIISVSKNKLIKFKNAFKSKKREIQKKNIMKYEPWLLTSQRRLLETFLFDLHWDQISSITKLTRLESD